MEVMRLLTLAYTMKIVTPVASHLVQCLCMQRSNMWHEMTKIEPHPEIAQVYALSSLRTLSTNLSLAATLSAETLIWPLQSEALPTIGKLPESSLYTSVLGPKPQWQVALPSPHLKF